MFDPLTVGAGLVLWQLVKRSSGPGFGVMTSEREEIYNNALQHLQDPEKLRKLADAFEREGLKAQGSILRKRADWRSRTDQQKKDHEAIFQKALKSKNVSAILEVAKAFESMTATQKAKELREHAEKLSAQSEDAPVIDTTAETTVAKPVDNSVS